MRKLKNNLIFLIPLLLTTTLSTYVTLPVVVQLVNGSNATDKTSEQSEETSQTEKPFFFLFNTELPDF